MKHKWREDLGWLGLGVYLANIIVAITGPMVTSYRAWKRRKTE